jgi:hypothetical protein
VSRRRDTPAFFVKNRRRSPSIYFGRIVSVLIGMTVKVTRRLHSHHHGRLDRVQSAQPRAASCSRSATRSCWQAAQRHRPALMALQAGDGGFAQD